MLLIVDYGIGNLRSLEKAFQAVGTDPVRSDDPADLARADKIVLPGVGAFGACMDALRASGLEGPALASVASGRPFLGIVKATPSTKRN